MINPYKYTQVPLYHTIWTNQKMYGDIFKGLGKFLGEPYHINIEPTVPPKRIPCRPMPIHQQEEFKHKLPEMQHADIIVPVHKATPWISSYVINESVDKNMAKRCTPTLIHLLSTR